MKLVRLTPLILFIFICGIHFSHEKKLYTNKKNYLKYGDCGVITHYKNGKVGSYMKWQIKAIKFDQKYNYFHLQCSKFNVGYKKKNGKCRRSRLIVQNGKNDKKMRYCGYKYMLDKKFNANENLMVKFNKIRGKKKMRDMFKCKICLKMIVTTPPPTTTTPTTTTTTTTSTSTTTTTTTTTTTKPPCESGWTDFAATKCYKMSSAGAGYNQARSACQTQSADLVSIHTLAEFNFVNQFMSNKGVSNAWVGGDDQADEGNFIWVDGTAVTNIEGVDKWNTGEPNAGGGFFDQDCMMMYNQLLYDEGCSSSKKYMCVKPR